MGRVVATALALIALGALIFVLLVIYYPTSKRPAHRPAVQPSAAAEDVRVR
jgi:hypothetical protein